MMGKDDLKHLSLEAVEELEEITGKRYYERLRELLGSKGWNNQKSIKDNKPKPYILSQFVRRQNGRLVRNSDLSNLKKRLREFIEK